MEEPIGEVVELDLGIPACGLVEVVRSPGATDKGFLFGVRVNHHVQAIIMECERAFELDGVTQSDIDSLAGGRPCGINIFNEIAGRRCQVAVSFQPIGQPTVPKIAE